MQLTLNNAWVGGTMILVGLITLQESKAAFKNKYSKEHQVAYIAILSGIMAYFAYKQEETISKVTLSALSIVGFMWTYMKYETLASDKQKLTSGEKELTSEKKKKNTNETQKKQHSIESYENLGEHTDDDENSDANDKHTDNDQKIPTKKPLKGILKKTKKVNLNYPNFSNEEYSSVNPPCICHTLPLQCMVHAKNHTTYQEKPITLYGSVIPTPFKTQSMDDIRLNLEDSREQEEQDEKGSYQKAIKGHLMGERLSEDAWIKDVADLRQQRPVFAPGGMTQDSMWEKVRDEDYLRPSKDQQSRKKKTQGTVSQFGMDMRASHFHARQPM
jgi:hypothetical protein